MELKHGYIQNPESIPAEYTGAGWIYFSEDDKSIYLDSGSGPIKYSGTDVDLSNYYTSKEIDEKIPSLDGYAKLEDIPSLEGYLKVDDIGDISLKGYATEKYVNEQIANIPIPEMPSLEGYAKLEDIPEVPSLDDYAKKDDIPSLSGFATEEWVSEQISDINVDVDLSDYVTKNELQNVEDKIPSVEGFVNEEFVTEKIAEIEIPDLNNYVTKNDISSAITNALPTFDNGLETINGSVGIKIDNESEFVSITENGLKVSGIQNTINETFNNYLNTSGITSKIVYLSESEWTDLNDRVASGETYWENNVIYMVYSND